MILDALSEKYLDDTSEYTDGTYAADNQNKFYIIETGDSYNPFKFLEDACSESFKFDNIDLAKQIAETIVVV